MTVDLECPVDGCGRVFEGDEKGAVLSQLRGHVNGSPGPDHDWNEVKGDLETPLEGEGEGVVSGDGSETDDQQPEGGEGAPKQQNGPEGTSPEGGSEGDEGEENKEMPTDSELERQREKAKSTDGTGEQDQQSEGDEGATEGAPEGGRTSPFEGGIPLPLDSTTVLTVAAIVLVVALLYAYTRSSSSSTSTSDSEDSSEGESESPGQGLVDDIDVDDWGDD